MNMSAKEKANYPIPVISDSELICSKSRDGTELLKLFNFENFYFPAHPVISGKIPDPRSNFPAIRCMDIRDDDVLICAYPKSGTHWLWEITKMITKRRAEYEIKEKTESMLEFNEPEEHDNLEKPRVFNTHLPVHLLPKQVFTKKCKILFIQRNPKDVVVSHFNHLKQLLSQLEGRFDDFLTLFIDGACSFGPWTEYIKEYEKFISESNDDKCLPLFFEDMKKTPLKEVKKVAQFLKVDIDDVILDEIAAKCNFYNLKAAECNKDQRNRRVPKVIFRKGNIGDWKNWFTVTQNEKFDDMLEKKMKQSKFTYTYT